MATKHDTIRRRRRRRSFGNRCSEEKKSERATTRVEIDGGSVVFAMCEMIGAQVSSLSDQSLRRDDDI